MALLQDLTKEELGVIDNFLPSGASVPKGLDGTFYWTGSYDNDMEIVNQLRTIRAKLGIQRG